MTDKKPKTFDGPDATGRLPGEVPPPKGDPLRDLANRQTPIGVLCRRCWRTHDQAVCPYCVPG